MRYAMFLVSFLISITATAQRRVPYFLEYFGSSRIETKQKMGQYLLFFGYKGVFSETDSTVDVAMTKEGHDLAFTSSFYFGKSDSCMSITNTHCDKYAAEGLDHVLGKKRAGWKRINERMYVERGLEGDLVEVLRSDSCFSFRCTRVSLTRRQFRALAAGRR